MTQIVARIDDSVVADVDRLVADGVVASRSEAVRLGLERFVDAERRRQIGEAIRAGYLAMPQTEDEFSGADEAARRMIAEEPW
ncbi:MAG: ribbon-helix-helix domain-containing protein [Ilumatobacteraceae bacterium]